jgi:hypothetical protein
VAGVVNMPKSMAEHMCCRGHACAARTYGGKYVSDGATAEVDDLAGNEQTMKRFRAARHTLSEHSNMLKKLFLQISLRVFVY